MLTIYSKSGCAGCVSAASYLESLNIPYNVLKIDDNTAAKEFILSQGHRQVPQIYFGEKLFVFGGWPMLRHMDKEEIEGRVNLLKDL